MNTINLLPADDFVVVNKTILHNEDRNILTMLYQPIIGSSAISLYYTLWSYLDRHEIISDNITHYELAISMGDVLNNILSDRKKLEAIGLLKTYYKKGSINSYIYELYSPLSITDFFNSSALGTILLNTVGDKEYKRILKYFETPNINTSDFIDISASFTSTFEFVPVDKINNDLIYLKRKRTSKINHDEFININEVLDMIADDILNKNGLTNEIKELILNISHLYDLNSEELVNVIYNSIDDKKLIDAEKLKQNARSYYSFEHSGKLPGMVYKDVNKVSSEKIANTPKEKIIKLFETTAPYNFLMAKLGGSTPSKSELLLLEYLATDLKLTSGVINVLIDYVLKVNNNKLTKSYTETIASQWKRENVKTVSEAMNLAQKEYNSKRKKTTTKVNKKSTPDWFNEDAKASIASSDEIKELDDLINSL